MRLAQTWELPAMTKSRITLRHSQRPIGWSTRSRCIKAMEWWPPPMGPQLPPRHRRASPYYPSVFTTSTTYTAANMPTYTTTLANTPPYTTTLSFSTPNSYSTPHITASQSSTTYYSWQSDSVPAPTHSWGLQARTQAIGTAAGNKEQPH